MCALPGSSVYRPNILAIEDHIARHSASPEDAKPCYRFRLRCTNAFSEIKEPLREMIASEISSLT